MALRAGRVGVKPSEVTKGGKIKGGGGSPYVLPVATATTLGGVKPVTKTEAMTKEVGVDSEGRLYVEPSGSGGGNVIDKFISKTAGDVMSAWFYDRSITRRLQSGAILVALPGMINSGYSTGVFYTLHDYGDYSNVISGDYPDKAVLENVDIPGIGVHNIYCYGGLGGGGKYGDFIFRSYEPNEQSSNFVYNESKLICNPSNWGNNYLLGPSNIPAENLGTYFNNMNAELKNAFWEVLALTL